MLLTFRDSNQSFDEWFSENINYDLCLLYPQVVEEMHDSF